MNRYFCKHARVVVALVIVAVVGWGISAQAATLGYWRFEDDNGSAVADGTSVPSLGTPIRNEVGSYHLYANATGPSWQGDDTGDLFGAAVPNPDPLDTDSNGTLNANGANTRSLNLDSSSHYAVGPGEGSPELSGPFTIEGYFRIDSEPAPTQSELFVYKRDNAQGGLGYQLWMDKYARVHVMVDNGPQNARVAWDDTRVDDGQWHHFAGVRDNDDWLHIYIDGVEDTTPHANGGGKAPFPGDLTNGFGLRVGSAGLTGMTGYLDEIRISNVALTPDQFLNAIPEPSSVALALLGSVFLAVRRRIERK